MAEAKIEITLSNGAKAGETLKELGKQANKLNKEIKDLKPGTEEFTKKAADLKIVEEQLGNIKTQIKGTTDASDAMKESFMQFVPFAGTLKTVGSNLTGVNKGVGGLISSMGVLRTAIISTGIGALVVLIGSLVAWFTKTEEGADKLKSVLYPLQVLFQKLTGIVAELGGKVFKRLAEAFNDPLQAIKDLGAAIYDNIIKRFEALGKFGPAIVKIFSGDVVDGFKDLGNAVIQLNTGIENGIDKIMNAGKAVVDVWNEAYQQGQLLLQLENDIEDAEIALTTSRAKLNVELQKTSDIARNTMLTDEERLEAARKVQAIQGEMTRQEENLLQLKLQRLKLEQDIDGILGDDERLERAKLEADIIQLQADNIEKNKKARALEINLIEEIAKREADIAKNIENLKVEAMKEGLEKEIAQIELSTEQKIEALIGSETQITEQKVLLQEIQEQQIQAVRDKYAEEQAAKDQKAKDEQKKRDDKAAAEKAKVAEQTAAFEANMNAVRLDSASDLYSGLGGLISQNIKDEKTAKNVKKAIGIGEIGFNLVKELSANALTAASNPLNAVTFGAAGAAQLVALNIASGLRAAIGLAKVALFKKGGSVQGPSHEQGGVQGVVKSTGQPIEFEGGEFFFSRQATRAIGADRLARLNDRYTRKFATGGPVSPFTNRPPVSSTSANQAAAGGPGNLESLLIERIEATDRRIDRIKVNNVVTETQDGINTINQIQDEADV